MHYLPFSEKQVHWIMVQTQFEMPTFHLDKTANLGYLKRAEYE